MTTSYTLTHNPNVYYKIVPAEDCSVNITAIGGGGGGGYRGVSVESEQTIFSTRSLVTNFLGGAGIVPVSINTVVRKSDWNAYKTFTRDNGVWIAQISRVNNGEYGDVETISYPKVFDRTFTVNFPENGTYNFYIAFDRNASVGIDGTTVYSQNNVNYAALEPPFVFQQYVNAGNRSIRFYVSREGSGSAALVITKTLSPVENPGGRGYPGDRVTANGIKLNRGEAIYAFVGAGGKAATSTTWGDGGSALLGYNGGNGGRGTLGKGGSGGGGGGATCVWRSLDNLSDPTINPFVSGPIQISPGSSEPISFSSSIPGFYPLSQIYAAGIVAGGGGGGGGGGITSGASVRSNYRHEPTSTYTKFSDAEVVAISYSPYNEFMNNYGVTLKGKFDSTGSYVFHRKISIPSTEQYRVFAAGDDYISIYLDNVPLLGGGNNFLLSQAQNYTDVTIPQGEHTITIQFENFSQKNACAVAINRISNGQTVWHTRSDLYQNVICEENFAPSIGGRGMTNSYNGGAGGGGGGGARGGRGGIYSSTRTNGAFSGTEGSSYVAPLLSATGITLSNGAGNNGGAAEVDGSNGEVTIESSGLLNIFYRQNGEWIPVKEVKQYDGSSWVNINEVSAYDNDVWKKVYTFEKVDLTLSSVTPSGNAQYSVRSLSNPPVLETLPQAVLSTVVQFSASSDGGSDYSGSYAVSSTTQTFDDGSTLTTTVNSDGTTTITATASPQGALLGDNIDSSIDSGDYGDYGSASGDTGGWV